MPAPGLIVAGRFELRSAIAQGAVGSVWLAFDTVLEREVAAKFLHAHLAQDPESRERFRVEALASARLRSPHAADVYDARREDDMAYLLMEFIDGPTLREVLDDGPLTPIQTAAVGMQVARALQDAHERAVIHRDVKPSNVMLSRSGVIKVVDFGLARAFESAPDPESGALFGSPVYVSPEHLLEQPVTGQADVFSLGVVLWECVVGQRPYAADHVQAVLLNRFTHPLQDPRVLDPSIPDALAEAIVWATEQSPSQRCPSAAALDQALAVVGGHRPEEVTAGLLRSRPVG